MDHLGRCQQEQKMGGYVLVYLSPVASEIAWMKRWAE